MKRINASSAIVAAAVAGLFAGAAYADSSSVAQGIANAAAFSNQSAVAGVQLVAHDGAGETHDCKGKNSCKGQGGCKSGDEGCKGKNSCKGKGGCSTKGEHLSM